MYWVDCLAHFGLHLSFVISSTTPSAHKLQLTFFKKCTGFHHLEDALQNFEAVGEHCWQEYMKCHVSLSAEAVLTPLVDQHAKPLSFSSHVPHILNFFMSFFTLLEGRAIWSWQSSMRYLSHKFMSSFTMEPSLFQLFGSHYTFHLFLPLIFSNTIHHHLSNTIFSHTLMESLCSALFLIQRRLWLTIPAPFFSSTLSSSAPNWRSFILWSLGHSVVLMGFLCGDQHCWEEGQRRYPHSRSVHILSQWRTHLLVLFWSLIVEGESSMLLLWILVRTVTSTSSLRCLHFYRSEHSLIMMKQSIVLSNSTFIQLLNKNSRVWQSSWERREGGTMMTFAMVRSTLILHLQMQIIFTSFLLLHLLSLMTRCVSISNRLSLNTPLSLCLSLFLSFWPVPFSSLPHSTELFLSSSTELWTISLSFFCKKIVPVHWPDNSWSLPLPTSNVSLPLWVCKSCSIWTN